MSSSMQSNPSNNIVSIFHMCRKEGVVKLNGPMLYKPQLVRNAPLEEIGKGYLCTLTGRECSALHCPKMHKGAPANANQEAERVSQEAARAVQEAAKSGHPVR